MLNEPPFDTYSDPAVDPTEPMQPVPMLIVPVHWTS